MIISYEEYGGRYVTWTDRMTGYEGAKKLKLYDPLVTIKSLIQCWEDHAEDANFHDMVGIPEKLVKHMRKRGITDEQIKAVLWDIVEAGGFVPW